jgi:hypothetical protein
MENALEFVLHLPALPPLPNESIHSLNSLPSLVELRLPSLGEEPRSVLDFLVPPASNYSPEIDSNHDSGYNSDKSYSVMDSQPIRSPCWESLSGFQAPEHYFLTELDESYFNALYTQ